ncbi:hypothetical protein J7M02_05100 [Candidatus Aerophobetes bacterium]|nr:hypothetical protein [Candidatus Aerophobetes bacterium]
MAKRISRQTEKEIVSLYKERFYAREIAKKLDISIDTVSKYLHKNGVTVTKSFAEKAPSFRGR